MQRTIVPVSVSSGFGKTLRMTARCVRVVQNLPISSSPHHLEKDVPPSVLSSGGALSPNSVPCTRLQTRAFKWPIQRHRAGMCHANGLVRSITSQGLRAPTPRPFHGGQGSLRRSLKEPIDQSLEICLSIWTEPCTNRPPFGYREQIAVQSRPTLRGLDAVSGPTLNPGQPYRGWMATRVPLEAICTLGCADGWRIGKFL